MTQWMRVTEQGRNNLFQRSMGMVGPSGALGYYWIYEEVPPAWVFFTWLGGSLILLLLSLRKPKGRR